MCTCVYTCIYTCTCIGIYSVMYLYIHVSTCTHLAYSSYAISFSRQAVMSAAPSPVMSVPTLNTSSPVMIPDPPRDSCSTHLDASSPQQRFHSPEHDAFVTPTHRADVYSHNNRHHRHTSPIPITDITQSPQRYGRRWVEGGGCGVGCGSPARELTEEEMRHHTPSSPLLTAVREAVDSINQYDDFEILEKIGAGFFADVFKVCTCLYTCMCM